MSSNHKEFNLRFKKRLMSFQMKRMIKKERKKEAEKVVIRKSNLKIRKPK